MGGEGRAGGGGGEARLIGLYHQHVISHHARVQVSLADRFAAGYGALCGLLMLWLVMTMTVETSWCGYASCRDGWGYGGVKTVELGWLPMIDNPTADGSIPAPDLGARCPAEPAAHATLVRSLVPETFRPDSAEAQQLYACVFVGSDGRPTQVHLVGGNIRPEQRRLMRVLIRDFWRFAPAPSDGDAPGWQRVRMFDASTPLFLPLPTVR